MLVYQQPPHIYKAKNPPSSDAFEAFKEIGYTGIYSMELDFNANHFGEDFAEEEAAFAIKVMRNVLRTMPQE